jgi:glycosyltransferase involved in cell wall biosynthesis
VAAWRPDKVIAISQLVANRIEKRYNRKVDEVVYPPFIPFANEGASAAIISPEFLLSFSRLVSYKRVDLAIKSCLALKKMLVVAGEGILKDSLIELAADQVYLRKKSQSIFAALEAAIKNNKLIVFVGHCSEQEKQYLFKTCKGFIMAGVEDFGLTALEAADAGVVPIINADSGVAEVLTDQKYAIHLQDKTVSALNEAILKLEHTHISKTALTAIASKYDQEHFSEAFMNTLYQFWRQHSTISPVKLQK